ncbi:unnamed protein product, partial [marine sediment metagenome]
LGFQNSPNIGDDYEGTVDLTALDSGLQNSDIVSDFPGTVGDLPVTVTMPDAGANNGLAITIRDNSGNADTEAITIEAAGSDTIDGLGSSTITDANGAKTYVSDGVTSWVLTGSNTASGAGQTGATGETGATGGTGASGETGLTGAVFLDATSLIEQFSVQSLGFVEELDTYCMSQYLPFAATILEAFGEVGPTGAEAQITVELDGVPVTGLSGATFTHSSTGYSATSSNEGVTGQKLTAIVEGVTGAPDDLCLTVITRRKGGG